MSSPHVLNIRSLSAVWLTFDGFNMHPDGTYDQRLMVGTDWIVHHLMSPWSCCHFHKAHRYKLTGLYSHNGRACHGQKTHISYSNCRSSRDIGYHGQCPPHSTAASRVDRKLHHTDGKCRSQLSGSPCWLQKAPKISTLSRTISHGRPVSPSLYSCPSG